MRAARLHTLQDVMADTLGDAGWLETNLVELESWFSVDDGLPDREWIEAAKQALIDASVLPEHAGAPLERVRAWNDVFIGTYRMNVDSGMKHDEAVDSARQNANDSVTLTAGEFSLTRSDPALYGDRRSRRRTR